MSEEATASGAVTISPTDMNGNAVTLTNDTAQVRKLLAARAMLANLQITFHFCLAPHGLLQSFNLYLKHFLHNAVSCRTNRWAAGA